MAVGILTISWDAQGRQGRGHHGLKVLTGRVVLSANSSFYTSLIEKRFRGMCRTIQMTVNSGFVVNWKRSATHKAGILYAFARSAMSTLGASDSISALGAVPTTIVSGTFVAIGR